MSKKKHQGPLIEEFYRHTETGNIYRVESLCSLKHPDTGDWIPACVYRAVRNERAVGERYCRSMADFVKKFTLEPI